MSDRDVLAPMVDELLILADRPEEEAKARLWADFNALQPHDRVPVCITYEGIPGPQWDLIFGPDHLRCTSTVAREIEFDLKKRLHMANHVPDDHVVWPVLSVGAVQASPPDWGVPIEWRSPDDELGAKEIVAPFAERIDLSRLRTPYLDIDEAGTSARVAQANELVGGRLPIHVRYPHIGFVPFDIAVEMRGMETLFFDVCDTPDLIAELMGRLTDAMIAHHRHRAEKGWLNCVADPSGRFQMVSTWRHIASWLPEGFAQRTPELVDEWAYISAQTSSGLGPEMYAQFVAPFDNRLAEMFDRSTVYYHGCECLDAKLDAVAAMPNLRRHHVSPWSSVAQAVAKYRGSVVLEVHAHPTEVFFNYTPDQMRQEVERLLTAANGHPMCLNLSDIHNLGENPETMATWAKVAQDAAAKHPPKMA